MTRRLPSLALLTILSTSISGCVVVSHDPTGLGGASNFDDEDLSTGSPLGSDDSPSAPVTDRGGSTGGTTSNPTSMTGGSSATGGVTSTGGESATGGATSSGGGSSTGGSMTGENSSTGGADSTGGSSSTGGADSTGGSSSTGGASSTGGTSAGGGNSGSCDGIVEKSKAKCGDVILFNGENYVCTSQASGVNGETIGCGTSGVYCNTIDPTNPTWGSTAWAETGGCE